MAKNINITDDMDLTKEIYDPVLLRKLVYKKYSEEDLIKELREFAETKLNPYAINSRGKSTNLLMIHFFREVQYKAKVESSKYTPDEILDHPDELKKVYDYLKTKPRVFSHEYPVDNLIHWYSNNRNTAGRVGNFSPVTARKIYESSMPKFNATIYDYSCVDKDTEFFDGNSWKKISEYNNGDLVLQYNDDGSASLVSPIRYIEYESDSPFYLYSGRFFNSCLTGNHTVVYRDRINSTSKLGDLKTTTMEQIVNSKSFRGRIPLTFTFDGDYRIDPNLLRLVIAVQADGTLRNENTFRIEASFSKERKIERFKTLLDRCNIEYTLVEDVRDDEYKNIWRFTFKSKEIFDLLKNKDKLFPKDFMFLTHDLKEIFLDEIFYWDGFSYGKYYVSNCKHNIDVVQFIMNSMGYRTNIYIDSRNNRTSYRVSLCNCAYSSYRNKFSIVNDKHKYCFEVPSHKLVLRRNNQVFITGNCGFGARMLGCLASQYNYKYLGTDPNSELFVSLNKFAPFVCDNLDRDRDYDIRCQGSEVFVPEWENTVDMSFSSPPYFTMELYSDDEGQSVNKYKEYDAWVKNYVQGTLNNIYRYTKKGGIHAVNLKNTDGKRMLEDWCLCALRAGFKLKRFEKINGEEGFLVKKMAHQSQRNFGKRDENGKLHRFNYEAGYEPIVYFVKE